MDDAGRVLTDEELLAVLIAEAQGTNAAQAVAILENYVTDLGSRLTDEQLFTLARVDTYCDVAVDSAALYAAVQREMERRGIWQRFRRRERVRVWLAAVRWMAGLILMAAGVLAGVFGLIIATKWILYWLGF